MKITIIKRRITFSDTQPLSHRYHKRSSRVDASDIHFSVEGTVECGVQSN